MGPSKMKKLAALAVVTVASSLVMSGCVTSGGAVAEVQPTKQVAEVYRGKYSFVRIEQAETSAAANESRTVDATQLRNALVVLRGKRNSFAGKPLFTAKELVELLPPLTAAIGKARVGEDVVFAITGAHGMTGLLQSQSVTTGRVFVKEGKLNIVFGLAQVNFEDELLGNHTLRPFTMGTRTGPVHEDAKLEGLGWSEVVPGRGDWLAIPLEVLQAKTPAPAAKQADSSAVLPAPADKATNDELDRAAAVERRLEILERLKQKGLISEDEYRDKRRVILMDI